MKLIEVAWRYSNLAQDLKIPHLNSAPKFFAKLTGLISTNCFSLRKTRSFYQGHAGQNWTRISGKIKVRAQICCRKNENKNF